MTKSFRLMTALALTVPLAPSALAAPQPHAGTAVLTNEQIPWHAAPADFPHGVEIAHVYGTPSQAGPFVIRVRMPAHSWIAPHTHNMDETLSVLDGHFTHSVGADKATATTQDLGPGGFVHLPKNTPHALRTGDSPVTMEISGIGPFGMTYLNPADDPSKTPAK